MKILAIEESSGSINWNELNELLKQEAVKVYELYLDGVLREIYFTANKNAVLVLEAQDTQIVHDILNTLPLVQSGLISFQILELQPYSGFSRLLK